MKYLIGILFLLATATAFGQTTDKPLVQFTGITRNTDTTHAIVPYVNITNVTTKNRFIYLITKAISLSWRTSRIPCALAAWAMCR
ncbi:hypothetical protein HK413_04205 [Mucilaginibacter sp. S1162]|uniref:Uncharacterized protein n=1 Tax=Mucilaginibacter humi TaxID=2732510 RepID=A0ABX1W2T7_9SPHI|nr:hypothetical protein [Mucilaginibacter humi]NNU33544.1 hypothetical protein [Mucilaginibacter humi]